MYFWWCRRNFINKLWNIGKFIAHRTSNLSDEERHEAFQGVDTLSREDISSFPLAEQFIVSRCHETIHQVTELIENYQFAEAGSRLQSFLWDDFADWYIEISKTRTRSSESAVTSCRVLLYVWDVALKALHPFIPFVTEALWLQIRRPASAKSVMISAWPVMATSTEQRLPVHTQSIEYFAMLKEMVTNVRNIRAEYRTEPGKKIAACLQVAASNQELAEILNSELTSLCWLAGLNECSTSVVRVAENIWQCQQFEQEGTAHAVIREDFHVFIPVADMMNVKQELERLDRTRVQLLKEICGLEARVNSSGFMSKAAPHVRLETNAALRDKKEKYESILKSIAALTTGNS